jgi:hypothetical protein
LGAVLEQLDGYKLVQLCLEERVGQLTGEVTVYVKEKQELQTHAMTIKNLWRTMEQVKQLGGKVSSHVESKQGLQKHVQELLEHLQGVVVQELGHMRGAGFSFRGSQRLRTLGSCCVVGLRESAESSWRRSWYHCCCFGSQPSPSPFQSAYEK